MTKYGYSSLCASFTAAALVTVLCRCAYLKTQPIPEDILAQLLYVPLCMSVVWACLIKMVEKVGGGSAVKKM